MSDEWISGKMTLRLAGEPMELEMTVPAQPVKVRRMLPVFQALANSFTEIGEAAAHQRGIEISCQKGCGACCRQPVPLLEAETYHLQELVENLPEPRRTAVKERFAEAVNQLCEIGWFERMNRFEELDYEGRIALIIEYHQQNIACPFLENESCSIYADRPLICREYLVISPPENCREPSSKTVRPLLIPAKVSNSVRQFNRHGRFVTMTAALEFARQVQEEDEIKTGPQWMEKIFKELTQKDVPAPEVFNAML